ncbi:toll/interleukin-1 receptor domain-containing protein [Streptomyces sp. Da 82-17]|uniref:toll/interleukin-1 receptor domain-containing protein n=1 Tax=Streptomyces sp. Da 82-17 TaxID=3377116 RepID=UPI0038D37093
MPEIFVNYRSGNSDHLAAALDEGLKHRFGTDAVFRDGRSIPPGAPYPEELIGSLRACKVLLVAVGPNWAASPGLRKDSDWVRKEILEARRMLLHIVPVLDSAAGERLDRDALPEELAWLADHQALPYAPYTSATDLAHIGDKLLDLVPELTDLTAASAPPAEAAGTHNTNSGTNHGTFVQARDVSGDIGGTIIKGNHGGQFHTGRGDQHVHHHDGPGRFTGGAAS